MFLPALKVGVTCDVLVCFQGCDSPPVCFECDSTMLVASSPFFAAALSDRWEAGGVVWLHEPRVSPAAFLSWLELLHCGAVSLEHAEALLLLADVFLVSFVVRRIDRALVDALDDILDTLEADADALVDMLVTYRLTATLMAMGAAVAERPAWICACEARADEVASNPRVAMLLHYVARARLARCGPARRRIAF